MTDDQTRFGKGRISEDLLQAYVDGRVGMSDRLAVESWLASHPEDAERLDDYARQCRVLHQLYDPSLGAPPSAEIKGLEWSIAHELRARRHPEKTRALPFSHLFNELLSSPRKATAAVAMTLSVFLAAGWIILADDSYESDLIQIAQFLNPIHGDAGPDHDGVREVVAISPDVTTSDDDSSGDGEAVRVNLDEIAPNLDNFGFGMVGARLLEGEDSHTLQYTYATEEGRRILLYIDENSTADKASLTLLEEGVVSLLIWSDRQRTYTLVGEVSRMKLLQAGIAVIEAAPQGNEGLESSNGDEKIDERDDTEDEARILEHTSTTENRI